MFLLDTNVVSELRKARAGKADPNVAAWARSVPVGSLFLSVIVVHELELGVLLAERRDPAQGAVLRAWLDGHVLPAFDGRIHPIHVAPAKCGERPRSPSGARWADCRDRSRPCPDSGDPERERFCPNGSGGVKSLVNGTKPEGETDV